MVAFIVAEIWAHHLAKIRAHHLAVYTELEIGTIMTFVLWVKAKILLALFILEVHLSVLQIWTG